MTDFEEKRQAKIDRAHELAAKARMESKDRFNRAHEIGSAIPMGQPILVGHYSEGRHRRAIADMDNNMRKSVEADEKARYYDEKAERLENSKVISSDDPEALTKLKSKLESLQSLQETMKASNKIIRNAKLTENEKIEKLKGLNFNESQAKELMEPGFMGQVGFAQYQLSNNNQNISTVKKRIAAIESRQGKESIETEINGVRMVDNIEENRLQAFFQGKPSDEIRSQLKHSGFRWSPSNGCWQSYRHQWSKDALIEVCQKLSE